MKKSIYFLFFTVVVIASIISGCAGIGSAVAGNTYAGKYINEDSRNVLTLNPDGTYIKDLPGGPSVEVGKYSANENTVITIDSGGHAEEYTIKGNNLYQDRYSSYSTKYSEYVKK